MHGHTATGHVAGRAEGTARSGEGSTCRAPMAMVSPAEAPTCSTQVRCVDDLVAPSGSSVADLQFAWRGGVYITPGGRVEALLCLIR